MTTYGYVRVSTKDQHPDRQLEAMRIDGVSEATLFVDYASGKDLDRTAYHEMLDTARPGDKLVLDAFDRLGRNYDAMIDEWKRLSRTEGIHIRTLDLPFMDSEKFAEMGDLGRMLEDMLLSVLSYKSDNERKEMLRRQRGGIEAAKKRGVYKGRKPTQFAPELIDEAQKALRSRGKNAAARVLGVDKTTVYRMLRDGRLVA